MKVKAIKKGFDNNKIREVGEVFEFEGKKCPSWCKPVGGKAEKTSEATGPVTVSKGTKIDDCVPLINAMTTVDEVEKFCIGDTRDGIQKAAEKRIAELSE